MSKFFLAGVSAFVLLTAFAVNVQADVISVDTASIAGWNVQYVEGGHFATQWDNSYFARTLSPADDIQEGNVWVNGGGRPGGLLVPQGIAKDGFYVFTYSLANLLPTNTASLQFTGTVGADDFLAAILFRGQDNTFINFYSNPGSEYGVAWRTYEGEVADVTGNNYDLVFVVRNTGSNMGLNIQSGAAITYTVQQSPPEGTVPEPATLALFGLGLAGLAVSRSRLGGCRNRRR